MKMLEIYGFLFTRLYGRSPGRTVFMSILPLLGVGCAFIPFDEKGSDEYVLGVLMSGYTILFACCIAFVFLSMDISGSRLMRTCPAAKALYTRGLTGFCMLIGAVCAAATLGARAAATIITGEDINVLSDLMVGLGTAFVPVAIIPLLSMLRYGMIAMVYLPIAEGVLYVFVPDEIKTNGFGAPMWAAALIMVGGLAASAVLSRVMCELAYAKMNFRPYVQAQQEIMH